MEYKAILPVELEDGVLLKIHSAEICIKDDETDNIMYISAITNAGHVYEELLDIRHIDETNRANAIRNCISKNSLKLRCILESYRTDHEYVCLALYDSDDNTAIEPIVSCGYFVGGYENVDNSRVRLGMSNNKLFEEQYKSIIQHYFDTQLNTAFK